MGVPDYLDDKESTQTVKSVPVISEYCLNNKRRVKKAKKKKNLESGLTLGILKCLTHFNEENVSKTCLRRKNHP